MATLTPSARDRLKGVHPDLVRVVVRCFEECPFQLIVAEGVRTKERQAFLYASGRTRPGPILTGTLNSRHIPGEDGFGKAVDLLPVDPVTRSVPQRDRTLYVSMAQYMMAAAKAERVAIRWGADWDRDGVSYERGEYDGPHFELLKEVYP